jgi:hypothetical protein
MTWFYGQTLAFLSWTNGIDQGDEDDDFDLGAGVMLELLDNQWEPTPLFIPPGGDRLHIVVEVVDMDETRTKISLQSPMIQRVLSATSIP